MKFVPPTESRLQCPECGVPVDVLETFGEGATKVRLEPCDHLVPAERIVL